MVTDPHVITFLGVSALWVDDRMWGFIFSLSIFLVRKLRLAKCNLIPQISILRQPQHNINHNSRILATSIFTFLPLKNKLNIIKISFDKLQLFVDTAYYRKTIQYFCIKNFVKISYNKKVIPK